MRARRASELIVMSAVERKREGHFTSKLKDKKSTVKGFDTDCLTMDSEDMAYVVGKEGQTRMKLAAASNAVLLLVGPMAFIAGSGQERQRCRDYLGFLLEQKDGGSNLGMLNRPDVTEADVSEDDCKYLIGGGLFEMRKIEQDTCTFCSVISIPEGGTKLLICGHEEGSAYSDTGRLKAERVLKKVCERPRYEDRGGGKGWSGGGGGWRRGRSRSPFERSRGKGSDRSGQEQWKAAPTGHARITSWTSSPWSTKEKKEDSSWKDAGAFNAWGGARSYVSKDVSDRTRTPPPRAQGNRSP